MSEQSEREREREREEERESGGISKQNPEKDAIRVWAVIAGSVKKKSWKTEGKKSQEVHHHHHQSTSWFCTCLLLLLQQTLNLLHHP